MNDKALVPWFVAGLVILVLLAMYVPKIAGGVVVLLVAVLGIRAAQKNLI